jgi:cytochrome c oxidase subunit III
MTSSNDQANTEHHQHHDDHGHHHDPNLAHHWESLDQQYDAAKFGMWLFVATEFLLFGGLFCLYAIYRANNPDLFQYGAQFLSTTMGAVNTVVLIVSSLTIAIAVRCAQLNQRRALVTMLLLTVLGGGIFMVIKYFEYAEKFEKNLVWGLALYEGKPTVEGETVAVVEETVARAGDPDIGRTLWRATCITCHGDQGQGVRGQAPNFRETDFVSSKTDEELLAFIKRGRMPFEPDNRSGIQMPPKGGNPLLTDAQILDIIAFMRTLDLSPTDEAAEQAEDIDELDIHRDPDDGEIEFFVPRSSVPLAGAGPEGIAPDWEARVAWHAQPKAEKEFIHPRDDPNRPKNLHVFFGIYFMMTGLHGLHVLVGMAIISALAVFAVKGRYSSAYYTPVEITGLYWHVVDLIWIFLFPLLYLIH